jgi:hypothetical protein
MRGSVHGQLKAKGAVLPTVSDRMNLVMTVPLAFGNAKGKTAAGQAEIRRQLRETAAGRWDNAYRQVAQTLIDGGYPDAVIRLGHEFTGGWYPWSAQGNAPAYIAAYQHVHNVMASVSPEFRFEWNAARNTWLRYGPDAYPGDAYVDIVGLDVYYEPWKGDREFTEDYWRRRYLRVLNHHFEFARSRGKQVSYAEWANGGVDEPDFIRKMHSWFASLPTQGSGSLLYHAYFNVNKTLYNLDAYPQSKAVYLQLFGSPSEATSPPPTTPPAAEEPTPPPTTSPAPAPTPPPTTSPAPAPTSPPTTEAPDPGDPPHHHPDGSWVRADQEHARYPERAVATTHHVFDFRKSNNPPPGWGASRIGFVVHCDSVKVDRIDPIVNPGHARSGHLHEFFGNPNITPHTSTQSLADTPRGQIKCTETNDKSGYWSPTVYQNGNQVRAHAFKAYYKGQTPDAVPMPFGLRMIAGDAGANRNQPSQVGWWQSGGRTTKNGNEMITRGGNSGTITLRVNFPNCWDGIHLDSPDHQSHVAYASNHRCPSSHPVKIPQLTTFTDYRASGGSKLTLSSGAWYTFHQDFWNAWSPAQMAELTETCIGAGVNCRARRSPDLVPRGQVPVVIRGR